MSTHKAISDNAVTNNGGSVLNGGTNYEFKPPITNRRKSSGINVGVFGSTAVAGVATSTNSTSFAKIGEVLAFRVSSYNINNVLLSGAADPTRRKSINRMEAVRTTLWSTAYRADKFSLYTGKFQAGFPQVSNDDAMVVNGGVYQDKAANPTRTVPGRLSYRTSAKNPVVVDYKRKNG